jgi:hypothetical protein
MLENGQIPASANCGKVATAEKSPLSSDPDTSAKLQLFIVTV